MSSSSKIQKPTNQQLENKSETITKITHASERSYKLTSSPVIKHLNLQLFKLNPCPNPKNHNHKHCVNYHNQKDRKRYGENYRQNMCEYIEKGDRCPYGDTCLNSHSRVEQLYQYRTYKQKFCSHYPNNIDKCQYQDYCSFAHNQQEILIELIHNYEEDEHFYMFSYKTVWCPFNLTQHDKALCVYAHNWQDYRRNPNFYPYQPIPCFNWKLKDYILEYSLGCQNGLSCTMCHGWKELHYHPSLYRTNKCQESGCRKGLCPNYHSQNQKRIISTEITQKYFKIAPKNRIVQGVFKSNNKNVCFKPLPGYKSPTQSMFEKRPQLDSKNIIKYNNNDPQFNSQKSECWVNKSAIDSEQEDPNVTQVSTQVDKLLSGE